MKFIQIISALVLLALGSAKLHRKKRGYFGQEYNQVCVQGSNKNDEKCNPNNGNVCCAADSHEKHKCKHGDHCKDGKFDNKSQF